MTLEAQQAGYEIVGRARKNTVVEHGLVRCHRRKKLALIFFSDRLKILYLFSITDAFNEFQQFSYLISWVT